ncbi:MAG TPA: nucleotide exchange factor GrpE [Gemmatimonadaceae bacterium]|nr:nucleotide exchange factor GrpE [Gemmatimonadaceae bacterium]
MKHGKKKGQHTGLPDQDAMGSADDYAPGASNQGDGQSGDGFSGASASGTAADPGVDTPVSDSSSGQIGTAAGSQQFDAAGERDKYLRLAAEYDNYRKRSLRERQDAGARAQGDLVRELLEALDDVARFAHVDPASTDAATVVQGVDMVERKLLKALGNAGLEVINPVGETFDPAVHEAVATEPTSAREDDHVVSRVYQPGYVFKSQLLRPARVVVKQYQG